VRSTTASIEEALAGGGGEGTGREGGGRKSRRIAVHNPLCWAIWERVPREGKIRSGKENSTALGTIPILTKWKDRRKGRGGGEAKGLKHGRQWNEPKEAGGETNELLFFITTVLKMTWGGPGMRGPEGPARVDENFRLVGEEGNRQDDIDV